MLFLWFFVKYVGYNKRMCDIAQVLSGCGVYDGSEIHEASAYV